MRWRTVKRAIGLQAGGGTGGCAVASRLRDVLPAGAVGVIEPHEYHYYQGAWTLVGAGIIDLKQSRIPTQEAIPNNAEWIQEEVVNFDPQNNKVALSGGLRVEFCEVSVALSKQQTRFRRRCLGLLTCECVSCGQMTV
ncbi:unnamed protein product [Hydatigera taeniaeformis]|uniref:Cystathionine beta-synthase n=1 Tax=Hydatigena taeniaeformis TaxID=6205 RepID=A0A0R3WS19_HYDTA|nr:unnamed protein product [Hydatigera taeniaeformis]